MNAPVVLHKVTRAPVRQTLAAAFLCVAALGCESPVPTVLQRPDGARIVCDGSETLQHQAAPNGEVVSLIDVKTGQIYAAPDEQAAKAQIRAYGLDRATPEQVAYYDAQKTQRDLSLAGRTRAILGAGSRLFGVGRDAQERCVAVAKAAGYDVMQEEP